MSDAWAIGRSASATGDAVLGSTTRCHALTKSCGVTGVPFDQRALVRIRKVYFVFVALICHDSAMAGIILPVGDSVVNPSYTSRKTSKEKLSVACAGSKVAGSPSSPRRIVVRPVRFALAPSSFRCELQPQVMRFTERATDVKNRETVRFRKYVYLVVMLRN